MITKKEAIAKATTSFCAQNETRTHTVLRPLPPQSSVYTNFTTCALIFFSYCAQNRTRTCTTLLLLVPETSASTNSAIWALFRQVSGKRDSNPRPQPWQGCALPTELFPQIFFVTKYQGYPSHLRLQRYNFFLD